MMISTKGRYALRVMTDLAENSKGEYIPMKEVAARQEISLKYLERILPMLVKSGLVEGIQGKGGGYRLTRSPEMYTVGEILRITEGGLAPVACLENDAPECVRKNECRTLPLWTGLQTVVNEYLDKTTLSQLMR